MVARRLFDFPTLNWRNPFLEMERMSRQMDSLANAVYGSPATRFMTSNVFPAVNITEDKNNYYVRSEIPGLNADELNLQVHGKSLSISGERKIKSEGDNIKYHRREREAGSFSRIIALPGDVNAENVEAKLVNGMLTVVIAKAEAAKPKQISVN